MDLWFCYTTTCVGLSILFHSVYTCDVICLGQTLKGNPTQGENQPYRKEENERSNLKKSFIKIGYKIRELWKFEKSSCSFYGDPQIGIIGFKMADLMDNSPFILYTNFQIFPIFFRNISYLLLSSTYVVWNIFSHDIFWAQK